jgi:hypothetical protein
VLGTPGIAKQIINYENHDLEPILLVSNGKDQPSSNMVERAGIRKIHNRRESVAGLCSVYHNRKEARQIGHPMGTRDGKNYFLRGGDMYTKRNRL